MGIILRHPAGGILQAFAAAENPNLSWKKRVKSHVKKGLLATGCFVRNVSCGSFLQNTL